MTQENQPRNLQEYVQQLNTPKIAFYRKVRKKIGLSIAMIDRWCNFDAATSNPLYLKALSEETGIAPENLFKSFEDEIS